MASRESTDATLHQSDAFQEDWKLSQHVDWIEGTHSANAT